MAHSPIISSTQARPRCADVVLVEDDRALSDALSFALGLEGFQVRAHRSARTVLAGDIPTAACLVIDYLLPGENGLGLLARLRSAGVNVPTFLITSHANALVRKRANELDALIIEKPLLGEELVSAIQRAVAAGQPT